MSDVCQAEQEYPQDGGHEEKADSLYYRIPWNQNGTIYTIFYQFQSFWRTSGCKFMNFKGMDVPNLTEAAILWSQLQCVGNERKKQNIFFL